MAILNAHLPIDLEIEVFNLIKINNSITQLLSSPSSKHVARIEELFREFNKVIAHWKKDELFLFLNRNKTIQNLLTKNRELKTLFEQKIFFIQTIESSYYSYRV